MLSPISPNGLPSIRSGASSATTVNIRTREKRPMRAAQRAKRDAFLDKIGTRPVVMGILNVTPDSFSDGGRFIAADAALSHATQMWEEGADIVDIGGESTRPGALPVTEAEELARIQFILAELGNREM